MMYNAEQVINGIVNYADAEVMGKLPTSGKWIAGTAIGLATTKATNIVNVLKENAIAKMLGIVDEDGMVDVDALLTAMKSSAEKYGKLSVNVPLIGLLSFSSSDVDALGNYIR